MITCAETVRLNGKIATLRVGESCDVRAAGVRRTDADRYDVSGVGPRRAATLDDAFAIILWATVRAEFPDVAAVD